MFRMRYIACLLLGFMTWVSIGCAGSYRAKMSLQDVEELLLDLPAGVFYQHGQLLLYYDLGHDKIFFFCCLAG